MDRKIDVSAQGLAKGLTKIALIKKAIEEAELKNQEKAQAIKHDQQKAEQEQRTAQLEQEKKELEIERQRLELLEKRLEIQKKEIQYALEIARELVDVLQPNADQATKAMAVQTYYQTFSSSKMGKG
jgi:Tfp pilus assembly protein PilF